MANQEDIITVSLAIIGILITLLIPIPIKEDYRVFIIAIIFFIFLLIFLNRFNNRLDNFDKRTEDINQKINWLDKRFKILEDLNDIRLDIRELQKMVFRK